MKMLSQKGLLLFGAVLAVCAFVVPSMASAASWSPINTTHQLFSPNLSFNGLTALPDTTIGSSCAASEFDVDVASASTLEITSGSFQACRGSGSAADCTATAVGTRFPWTATGPSTTDVQIHGIHVDVLFEVGPGLPCTGANGAKITLTGTLTGGSWDPSSITANRRVTYRNASGLTGHAGGAVAVTVNGDIRDTTGTLDLLM